MSFLSALGGDIKKVFSWVGSPKGQAIVKIGETIVEDAFPAATGVVNLLNAWGTEIFKSEAMAEAAGQGEAGVAKSAAVLNVLTPQVLAFFQSQNKPIPGSATIQKVNDNLVEIMNLLSGAPPPPATPPVASTP